MKDELSSGKLSVPESPTSLCLSEGTPRLDGHKSHNRLSLNMCLYQPITQYITSSTNLRTLFDCNFDVTSKDNQNADNTNRSSVNCGVLLSGLHTCGNLASSMLRIFSTNPDTQVLCTVGCCYNLLTGGDEALKENETIEIPLEEACGFPLSSSMKGCGFTLSRNAKLLAAQAADRLSTANQASLSLTPRCSLTIIEKIN